MFSKSFPLRFILTVRPRLRRFQGESALMEKPNDGLITALDLVAVADMPVKRFGGPKRSFGFFRLFEKLNQLLGLLSPKNGGTSGAFLDDESVYAFRRARSVTNKASTTWSRDMPDRSGRPCASRPSHWGPRAPPP